jgi:pimeloyl-ACP methyl ester carboxylesterase
MRHMPLSEGMSIFETVGLHDYPVGLFWGDQDEICPYENRNAVLQSIPRAHLYIVEGGGHAVHLDRPDIFQRAFLRFLEA